MTVTHEELSSAFHNWGLEITRATPKGLADKVPSEDTRNVLLQVGLPERLGDHYFFHDLSTGCLTLGEALRTPIEGMQDFIYLGSGPDDDTILLNGSNGEILSWRQGSLLRINTTLSHFIQFLYLVQVELNRMEEADIVSESDLQRRLEEILSRLREADQDAFEEASEYWRNFLDLAM